MTIRPFMIRIGWALALFGVLAIQGGPAMAEEKLKPFVLVSNQAADPDAVLGSARQALTENGFTVAGEYAPYDGARILVVTSDALRSAASKSDMGGFGAIQRVSVTEAGDKVQLAYTNPRYMANVYRMQGELAGVAEKLATALGEGEPYGAEGLTAKELRNYHYKLFMPYFDEPYELGSFDGHQAAVKAVEEGLAQGFGGVSKVYRVDVQGKDEVVFGVHMTEGCSGDQYIMERVDFKDIKSTPHLPYEVLVSGNEVLALHAKFRIAQSFPDLSMMGSNSFFSIMCAPDAIEEALKAMVHHGEAKEAAGW